MRESCLSLDLACFNFVGFHVYRASVFQSNLFICIKITVGGWKQNQPLCHLLTSKILKIQQRLLKEGRKLQKMCISERKRESERERERQIDRERQRQRETDRQTRQTDRESDRARETETVWEKERERETERERKRERERMCVCVFVCLRERDVS